jgi:nitroreductase
MSVPVCLARPKAIDVLEAINSRFACRHYLDTPVSPPTLRSILQTAARSASSGNLQPWKVYALSGEPLAKLKSEATRLISEVDDWRVLQGQYPDYPEKLCEPYLTRREAFGTQLYGALGIDRHDGAARLEQIKRNFNFFGAPIGLLITIDRRLGPGQWADLGGYINLVTLAARAYGIDTCPQVLWTRFHGLVATHLQLPPDELLFCGMALGYGDKDHPINQIRTCREHVDSFCKFIGFDG